jgi:hypothetical protein
MKDLKFLQSVGNIEATDLSNGTIAVSL